jgi:hypothetical protein
MRTEPLTIHLDPDSALARALAEADTPALLERIRPARATRPANPWRGPSRSGRYRAN